MTSSPLFIMVAESIVIFGPIFHVGCASASSTVIASNVSRSALAEGPPDAVRTSRRASSARPLRMAWWIALCSESTGISSAPLFLASSRMSSPATTSGLLVGEGEPLSGADRGMRRAQAQRADEAPHDGIGLRVAGGLGQAVGARDDAALRARGQGRSSRETSSARSMATSSGVNAATCSASFSIERPAASAATRNRSG